MCGYDQRRGHVRRRGFDVDDCERSAKTQATLWLSTFPNPGSVLAVDVLSSSVQFVQSLLDGRKRPGQAVKATLAAVGDAEGASLNFSTNELTQDLICACYFAGNKLLREMRRRRMPVRENSRFSVKIKRPGLCHWDMLEAVESNHHCRVSRQRLGLSPSKLPFVPYDDAIAVSARVDSILKRHLPGEHVHFLKIDVDLPWARMFEGLLEVLSKKSVSVVTLEFDPSNYASLSSGLSEVQRFLGRIEAAGYDALLKVACDDMTSPSAPAAARTGMRMAA